VDGASICGQGVRVQDTVRRFWGTILTLIVAITISSFFTGSAEPRRVIAATAIAPSPEPVLQHQAAALRRGDLSGWLTPVDPPLRTRYRHLFESLRAVRATTVDYHVVDGRPPRLTAELSYCFAPCTGAGPRPRIRQTLTVRAAGDTYVITELTGSGPRPTPWEAGDLVFRQGRRVTVGAPRSLAGRLSEVTAIADRAAVVDDRYAVLAGNRQTRYRIFLATGETWRTWYGGKSTVWAVGYMQPLGAAGADVVLHLDRIPGRSALRRVIQHELGHVATIGGVVPGAEDRWLVEGVAEYIAAQPRRIPTTTSRSEPEAFYARARAAVDCLVTKFGEGRVLHFVRLRLRLGNSLDAAAYRAFGRSFTAADRAC
jgi:hypothetical protein